MNLKHRILSDKKRIMMMDDNCVLEQVFLFLFTSKLLKMNRIFGIERKKVCNYKNKCKNPVPCLKIL